MRGEGGGGGGGGVGRIYEKWDQIFYLLQSGKRNFSLI